MKRSSEPGLERGVADAGVHSCIMPTQVSGLRGRQAAVVAAELQLPGGGSAPSHAIRPGAGSTQTSASRAFKRGPASGKSSAARRTSARSPSRRRQARRRPLRVGRRAGSSRAPSPTGGLAQEGRAAAATSRRGGRSEHDVDLPVVGGHDHRRVAQRTRARPAPPASRPVELGAATARSGCRRRRSCPSRGG